MFSTLIADQSAVSSPLQATAAEFFRLLSSIEERLITHTSPIPNPGEVDLLRVTSHSTNTAHTLANATGATVPPPLLVGSAIYAQEIDPSSRTITANGTHIASVLIGDDIPLKRSRARPSAHLTPFFPSAHRLRCRRILYQLRYFRYDPTAMPRYAVRSLNNAILDL
jgi:hypothetical protein